MDPHMENFPPDEPTGQTVWQRKLLPLMAAMVVGLTAFFFIASLFQLYSIHQRIQSFPTLEMDAAFQSLDMIRDGPDGMVRFDAVRWKTLVMLEKHAVQQRYHQANVLLMARIWISYLGFVTGMTLSLVGAVFILGKLREPVSTLTAEGQGFKGHISSSSPGLILVFLGTVLMVVTITTHHNIEVKDGPLYTAIPYVGDAGRVLYTPEDVMNLKAGSRSGSQKKNTTTAQEADRSIPETDAMTEELNQLNQLLRQE